jgi:hypothetical protein
LVPLSPLTPGWVAGRPALGLWSWGVPSPSRCKKIQPAQAALLCWHVHLQYMTIGTAFESGVLEGLSALREALAPELFDFKSVRVRCTLVVPGTRTRSCGARTLALLCAFSMHTPWQQTLNRGSPVFSPRCLCPEACLLRVLFTCGICRNVPVDPTCVATSLVGKRVRRTHVALRRAASPRE